MIVPRRLRADWRQEWETELQYREWQLADWDRLDWRHKLDLLRRSASAFWDALSLQPRRLEDEVIQDLRYGIRMLFAQPGFTAVAVLTLALGIGANTAIFTVVNALLLRPLAGVTEPDRLVQIGRKYPDKTYLSDSSYPDYLDYRAQNTVMSGLALLMPTAFHLSTGQEAERVEGEFVSANYFEVLGVQAAQGRLIAAFDEQGSDANRVAVISYRLWQRRFGGDPGAVGRTHSARFARLHRGRRRERGVRRVEGRRHSRCLGAASGTSTRSNRARHRASPNGVRPGWKCSAGSSRV